MSNGRKRRQSRRWARYINHYGHIPYVIIGGWGAVSALDGYGNRAAFRSFFRIRQQQQHPHMKGYYRS